jgi:hypothetical protein
MIHHRNNFVNTFFKKDFLSSSLDFFVGLRYNGGMMAVRSTGSLYPDAGVRRRLKKANLITILAGDIAGIAAGSRVLPILNGERPWLLFILVPAALNLWCGVMLLFNRNCEKAAQRQRAICAASPEKYVGYEELAHEAARWRHKSNAALIWVTLAATAVNGIAAAFVGKVFIDGDDLMIGISMLSAVAWGVTLIVTMSVMYVPFLKRSEAIEDGIEARRSAADAGT